MFPESPSFFLIAGPCVLESEELAFRIASTLQDIASRLGLAFCFKASFDKANRSSVDSYRGPGMEAGLEVLGRIRDKLGVPVTTDVHETAQAAAAAAVVDLLQVPAFLSRQTDLLLAAAATGKPINVKKGQFLAASDMDRIAEKLRSGGCRSFFFTERGTSFGYHDLVVDMRNLAHLRKRGYRVIFDATHSIQRPSALGSASGGDRDLAFPLARAAVAVGVDGLFLETHPSPEQSPSDGATMIPLAQVSSLLEKLLKIHAAAKES
ncbi:2-dehydro-3-deoxyphosphooctonate aldolase (KDO 8-P synthase) [Methylacidimicrobium cyclopophantes]|uniref:2-dehydro-3-deoxyphosphooctonate aldolase n=1 Tax=Methylacidimicrobium cyclopophantes TaxID=1041766 RepID=A0A5E6MQQ6_9BACT|nr:3-deoxy-8-phosphooctulonate synthase [Methylacidimicrobium cyclopophantes]VVM08533.1 2-dehydro-3-deoxyphosphooctonate aldolase (KDO 8-P synthase) [Methylacidimicrobium cyclopophantes]